MACQTGPLQYSLWIRRDCEGSPFETAYRTWFHFSVTGAARGATLSFTLCNMNKQAHLYRFGFRPVVKAVPSRPTWDHIPTAVTYEVSSRKEWAQWGNGITQAGCSAGTWGGWVSSVSGHGAREAEGV